MDDEIETVVIMQEIWKRAKRDSRAYSATVRRRKSRSENDKERRER